jgi:MFS family permease
MDTLVRLGTATRRRQVMLVALLVLAGVVNYFDRAALSIANETISNEMHLSSAQMGFLLSAFAWTYGLAQLPAGLLSDRFGPRIVLAAAMAVWSTAQVACGLVRSYGQFVFGRLALGLGESPMFTSGARAIVEWFPLRERGTPLGLFNASSALAPALAPPLLTPLMLSFGWRALFVAIGVAGLGVAMIWFAFYRDLAASPVSQSEAAAIRHDDVAGTGGATGWTKLLTIGSTWAMIGGAFGTVYITWLYIAWLPFYLERVHHLNTAQTGLVATIPLFAGFIGGAMGGIVCDGLARLGVPVVASRKAPIIVGLLLAGLLTLVLPLAHDEATALILISLAMLLASGASSASWALGATLAPQGLVATVEALQNVGGSLGGALAPLITGIVLDVTHGFGPAFVMAGLVGIASGVSYALVAADAYQEL